MTYFSIERVDGISARPLAVVRAHATFDDLRRVIGESFDQVYAFLADASIAQDGHNIVLYTDRPDGFELAVGVEVSDSFDAHDGVEPSTSPSGAAAHAEYYGDYSGLPEAHAAVRWWCGEHGYRLAGINWEVYGDWHDDPTQRRADVYYLLDNRIVPGRAANGKRPLTTPFADPDVKVETDEGVVPTLFTFLGLVLMGASLLANWWVFFGQTPAEIPAEFLFDSNARTGDPSLLVVLVPALVLGVIGILARRRNLLFACAVIALLMSGLYALQANALRDDLNRVFSGLVHFSYGDFFTFGPQLCVAGAFIVLVTAFFVKPRPEVTDTRLVDQ